MADYPINEYLAVVDGEDIYKTENWWKAVVQYRVDGNEDAEESAIYLWHNESDGWSRKNKYVIKTADAWEQDRSTISHLLTIDDEDDTLPVSDVPEDLPVSDYYTVSHTKTIFKEADWWKAITRITAKGDYETTEVIVYLWQADDNDWKCRQKYAVKDLDDWTKEQELVSKFISDSATAPPEELATDTTDEGDDIDALLDGKLAKATMADHLSDEYK